MSISVVLAAVVTLALVAAAVRAVAFNHRSIRAQAAAAAQWELTGKPVPGWERYWAWAPQGPTPAPQAAPESQGEAGAA